MTFEEIIQENCRNHSAVQWWPLYAYHYTDVENAVRAYCVQDVYTAEWKPIG